MHIADTFKDISKIKSKHLCMLDEDIVEFYPNDKISNPIHINCKKAIFVFTEYMLKK